MNREQLAHIARAAARIANDSEVIIPGSQSVLATAEADVAFWGDDAEVKADIVVEESILHDRATTIGRPAEIIRTVRGRIVRCAKRFTADGEALNIHGDALSTAG